MKVTRILAFMIPMAAACAQTIFPAPHNVRERELHKSTETEAEGVATVGIPFSGSAVTTQLSQTPGFSQVVPSKFFRDAQGRTRTEQRGGGIDPWSFKTSDVMIYISDPVAGVAYFLDRGTLTGSKSKLRPVMPTLMSASSSGAVDHSSVTNLGTQTILGLECTGTKSSHVISGGSSSSQPITVTTEQWYSGDLKVIVKRRLIDPRGTIDFEFESLSRAAPDPALFLPPRGFVLLEDLTSTRSGQ